MNERITAAQITGKSSVIPKAVTTEERRITRIEGNTLHLDHPLDHSHSGSGDFRCEVANLAAVPR